MSKTIKSSDGVINIGPTTISQNPENGTAIQIPSGNSLTRPPAEFATAGQLRWNSDTAQFEGYNGYTWSALATTVTGGPVVLASYTVSQLSSLSTTAGGIVYCTNVGTGAEPVFWDGTNWRKFSDRSIVT